MPVSGPDQHVDELGEDGWGHHAYAVAGDEVGEELRDVCGGRRRGVEKGSEEILDDDVGIDDDDGGSARARLRQIDDATRHLGRHRPDRLSAGLRFHVRFQGAIRGRAGL